MVLDADDLDRLAEKIVERLSMTKEPQPLTREELADHLKVSPSTVDRWRAAGTIPAFKCKQIVLFWLADVTHALKHASYGV